MSTPISPLEQLEAMGNQQQVTPSQPQGDLSPLEQLEAMKPEAAAPGADIKPVTTATNPKLAEAEAGKDLPEYVGAVGAAGAGLMGAATLEPAFTAVINHLGGLDKIVKVAKALGYTSFGLKEAHDLYKHINGDSKK